MREKISQNETFAENVIKRFIDKLKASDNGCIEWNGVKTDKGYGEFTINKDGKFLKIRAHRWALGFAYGGVLFKSDFSVCHHCDNPSCVNPQHLFLGTNNDNVKDKVLKNRAGQKLTADKVKEIKNSTESTKTLMEKFDVGKTTINYVKSGKTWKHV